MKPKQILIISGKGGTGKTSITGSFAALAKQAVLADCDVDAADLALILGASTRDTHAFSASRVASIDLQGCSDCGLCASICRSEAIQRTTGTDVFRVDPLLCEGCEVCYHICPEEAIRLTPVESGRWFFSETRFGPLYHAELEPGEENSGRLVALVRTEAQNHAQHHDVPLVLIDGPPGIGCPVIASLSGVDFALIVTEASLSGIHDMDRVLQVCRHFDIPAGVCLNRWDLNKTVAKAVETYCETQGLPLLARIPFDPIVVQALVAGEPVVTYSDGPISALIRQLYSNVIEYVSALG